LIFLEPVLLERIGSCLFDVWIEVIQGNLHGIGIAGRAYVIGVIE
jgi:hypothetical protein